MFYKIINSMVGFVREKTNLTIKIYLVCLFIFLLSVGIMCLCGMPKIADVNPTVSDSIEIEEGLLHDTINQIEIREENFSKISEKKYQDLFYLEEEIVEEIADVDNTQID